MLPSLSPATSIPKSSFSDRRFNWTVDLQSHTGGSFVSQCASLTATAPQQPGRSVDVSSRFGLRLRELRRERNLTQARMASEFGIDRSFISDVERGRKSISLPMLEVISLGMKISLSELLRNI